MVSSDDKYVTFRREEFLAYLRGQPKLVYDDFENIEVRDAVVIRRQDYFASPALAGYAASIAIALHLIEDIETRAELQAVADYFEDQSRLAAEEGWKFPDV